MKDDRYTVMVVEDCEPDADALVACLGGLYRIKVVSSGIDALEEFNREVPDLILMDVLMPEMDGFEVCRRLREADSANAPPIIFITSLTDAIDEAKGLALGAVDYITKPFNFHVIRARIKTHLALARAKEKFKEKNKALEENIRFREQIEQVNRHDLKSPLNVILGNAQMLGAGMYDSPAALDDISKALIKAGYAMLEMINRTIDLYKMEQGAYAIECRQIDILPLIDRVLAGLSHAIDAKSVRVTVNVNGHARNPDTAFAISCDEMLLYSLLSNLIDNAVHASPVGETICLFLSKDKEAVIDVCNIGAVSPGIRDRFFEKFVTHGKRNGTGLGTYAAWLSARIHGGTIRLTTSDEDNTTGVSVSLPV